MQIQMILPFQLWAVDSLIKVFSDTPPEKSDLIEVNCAQNEYQSAQFAITAQKQLGKVTIEIGKMTHESGYILPPENISWNFVGYVSVKAKYLQHT